MQEAVEGIAESGRQVTVLAPSVKASHDVLRQEGFAEADTVARFLKDREMQEKARGHSRPNRSGACLSLCVRERARIVVGTGMLCARPFRA